MAHSVFSPSLDQDQTGTSGKPLITIKGPGTGRRQPEPERSKHRDATLAAKKHGWPGGDGMRLTSFCDDRIFL